MRTRKARSSWKATRCAVVSEAAAPSAGRQCMDSVDQHLYSKYGIHLLWPSFSKPDDDIGYVTRVYKGIKENGAIFSHPNPWAIVAECKLGRGERAMKFYDSPLPYNQNDMIEIRESEPYSYCQFVMGRDHTAYGRARHPWLTGSGGWTYLAATHWILGIRPGYAGLTIDPCIPGQLAGLRIARNGAAPRTLSGSRTPLARAEGVQSVLLDGRSAALPIPAQPAAFANHDVIVTME